MHILNLLMDIVYMYLSTSAYSVLCFFMKWIIIVCGLSSEVNILGYATSTSYRAKNHILPEEPYFATFYHNDFQCAGTISCHFFESAG